jgi:hypothetical protein
LISGLRYCCDYGTMHCFGRFINNRRMNMSNDIKKIVIKNTRVKWAKVQEPALTFDEDGMEYSLDLELSDKQIASLRKSGMSDKTKAKEDEDGTKYVTFRKPTHSRAGKELVPLKIVDRNKKPFTELLGNGTVVNIVLALLAYDGKFGKGVVIRPEAIQVIDHVEYAGGSGNDLDLFDAEDADDDFGEDADFI